MKRIEAIIPPERVNAVSDALEAAGVIGITITDGKGKGLAPRPELSAGSGTSTYVPKVHARTTIVTVVDDSKLDAAVNVILNTVSTGSPGDGKIFVTNVEEAIDIGSKKRGKEAV